MAKTGRPPSEGDVSYSARHKRNNARKGYAKNQECVFGYESRCSRRMSWAWNNVSDPNDPESFFPACQSHNMRFDFAVAWKIADHGSIAMYQKYHCRCSDCRTGNTIRMRRYKAPPQDQA